MYIKNGASVSEELAILTEGKWDKFDESFCQSTNY